MNKSELVKLEAEPEPLEIDLSRTAVIVIDMQNCFCSKGGMFDLQGYDLSGCQNIIKPIQEVTGAARARGCKVIYMENKHSHDLRECGGPDSMYWYRGVPKLLRERPETRDKLTLKDTWGSETIEELKPQEGDIVVEKPKFNGFVGTELHLVLQTHNVKYLVFTGTATNVCVESTLRDAYFHGYWSILIPDACAAIGPPATQEATIWNVKTLFGWVATTESFVKALK